MKLKQTQSDLAVAYVKGELEDETLTDFEAAIDNDEALREEVLFQRSILGAVRLNVAAEMLQQATYNNLLKDKTLNPKLDIIQNNLQQARIKNINRQKRIRRWWLGVAAACLIIVGIFGDNLISSYQARDMISDWQVEFGKKYDYVSGVNDTQKFIQIAERQYNQSKIDSALITLNQITNDELSAHILLAKGKIQAQLKKYNECQQTLLLAIELDKNITRDKARAALGMVYLRLGKNKKAKEQFKRINDESIRRETKLTMKKYLWFYPDFY